MRKKVILLTVAIALLTGLVIWVTAFIQLRIIAVDQGDVLDEFMTTGIWLFLGVIFLVALLAVLVSRHLTRPFKTLMEGVRRFADGELQHRIPLEAQEDTRELVELLNRMAEELDRHTSNLEALVENETRKRIAAEQEKRRIAERERERAFEINRVFGHDFPMLTQVPIDTGVLLLSHVVEKFRCTLDSGLADASATLGYQEELEKLLHFMRWSVVQGNEIYGFMTRQLIHEKQRPAEEELDLEELDLAALLMGDEPGEGGVDAMFKALLYLYANLKFGILEEDAGRVEQFLQGRLSVSATRPSLPLRSNRFLLLSHTRNLVANALKSLRLSDVGEAGDLPVVEISLDVSEDGRFALVTVADRGPGLPGNKLAELRKVFSRPAGEVSLTTESSHWGVIGSRVRRGQGLRNIDRELRRLGELDEGGPGPEGGYVRVNNRSDTHGAVFTLWIHRLLKVDAEGGGGNE